MAVLYYIYHIYTFLQQFADMSHMVHYDIVCDNSAFHIQAACHKCLHMVVYLQCMATEDLRMIKNIDCSCTDKKTTRKCSFSLLDSSIKRRMIAHRLVIKQLIMRAIFLSRGFWSASGYLGSVRCLAIIWRFILWWVSDEKVLLVCWKYDFAFLCHSRFCSTKHLFNNHNL